MIYPSLGEGFGLPPVESLSLGIPVIVSETMPSIAGLAPLGQLRLQQCHSESIRSAIELMMEDDFAKAKYEELERLKIPSWSAAGRAIVEWMLPRQSQASRVP